MRIAAVLSVLVFTLGCAKPVALNVKGIPIYSPSGDLQLVGREGVGHACPAIGPNGNLVVLTAGHVVYDVRTGQPKAYAWSDSLGNEGYVEAVGGDRARDLAILQVTVGIPVPYPVAQRVPEPGDEVHWFEYDFRAGKILATRLRVARVTRVVSGHIVFDAEPVQGASGACLLSDTNEILGVVTWGIGAPGSPSPKSGVAVGVYGYR